MTGGMRKKWIRKVWHGTAHPEEAADHEVLEQRMKVFAVYALLFLLLTVVRYSLGFSSVDGGVLHARVVEALLGGDNWGRQALVASQEFPLIPTVTLLGAEVVAVPLGLTGTHLLVAVVQVWTLSYLVRLTPAGWMARLLGVVIVGIMLLFPFFRDTWAVSDPHWVVAVPLMAMVYHGVCWTDTEQLRDVVMVGVAAGILVFCGFTGIFLSLVMLALFTMQLRHSRSLTARDIYGVRFVLWAPWCYCLALSLLLSWLIMGDPWPGWERLVDQIRIVSLEVFRQECWTLAGALSPAMAAAAAMGVLTVKTPIQKMGIWLVTGLVSVLVTGVVLNSVKVFAAGFSVMMMILGTAVVVLIVSTFRWEARYLTRTVCCLIVLGLAMLGTAQDTPKWEEMQTGVLPSSPTASRITSLMDRFWPEARVVVPTLRAATIFGKAGQDRFLASVDFYEETFRDRAREEQLFLLVPPCNGIFYPTDNHVLADIHRHGRPWLMLENEWASGWQLWRCVLYTP